MNTDGISRADRRNGNPEEDGFESLTLTAQGGLNLAAGARLEGSLLWNGSDTEFDSFRFGAEGNVGDGDELSKTEELTGHIALKAPLFGGRLDNLLLVGRSGNRPQEPQAPDCPPSSAEGRADASCAIRAP